jgi:hypothetical protein
VSPADVLGAAAIAPEIDKTQQAALELLRDLVAGSNRHHFIGMDTVPSDLIDSARALCEGTGDRQLPRPTSSAPALRSAAGFTDPLF